MQEVDHVVAALGLAPGMRVLDVGCGPGRHAHELARRGIVVHGDRHLGDVRRPGRDGRARPARRSSASTPGGCRSTASSTPRSASAKGAFGLMTAGGEDAMVVAGMARALRPGGRLALSAFNAYFAVRYHDDGDVRRRHRRVPRAHRGPRRRPATWPRSTCGPAATRHASCACCSPSTASSSTRISSVEPGAYGADAADHRVPRVPRPRDQALTVIRVLRPGGPRTKHSDATKHSDGATAALGYSAQRQKGWPTGSA